MERLDHGVGEGVEEDGACLCSGDGWFPQLFKAMEDGKSKLELLEVVARRHELWHLLISSEVIGKAVTGLDAVGDKNGWCQRFRYQKMNEGEEFVDKIPERFGGFVCLMDY